MLGNHRRRCAHLAAGGLGLALSLGIARAQAVLKVETVDVPWGATGTYHYVDELRLSAGPSGAPLVLRSDLEHDVLAPIPGPQYPLGDRHVLLLGWSSTGGGAETLHALVLEVTPAGLRLRRHLTMTRDRGSSLLLVRRAATAKLLLGLLEPLGPAAYGDEDYSLVLGPAAGERLSWTQVRRLAYVNVEVRATDSFYAPPFGATVGRALVNDGAVGSEPFVQKLVHPRVAWIAVGPEDVALSPPPD